SLVYDFVSYPIPEIEENLDWVNLIAYDFYCSSTLIVLPAALFDPSNPKGPCRDSGLKEWIKAGLSAKKAVLGFLYVGGTWSLEGDKVIRRLIVDHKARSVYDSTVVGDYCFAGTSLIGYDDHQSVVRKVRYAKKRGADDNSGLSRAASQAWDAKESQRRQDEFRVKPKEKD
ncbi:Glycoside hydrolase superfamily, partial [Arabidopsis thaliana x Arabidopsis arenosa]